MAKFVITSAHRTFATAGIVLSALAAGVAMARVARSGKSSTDTLKKLRAMAEDI